MDITSITAYRVAHDRSDLALGPGETVLAGGTWLMSEPQPDTTGFVDLSGMAWPDIEVSDRGLRIGATCTIATLVAFAEGRGVAAPPSSWTALPLVVEAANALLASFKIWNTATVGGNVCRAYAAAAMISFAVALDGVAVVWGPAGDERRLPVAEVPTGNGTTSLAPGEVLRALEIPASALRSTARLRKIALAEHGRSGAVVTGRVDPDGAAVFAATAATLVPVVRRFSALPSADAVTAAFVDAPGFYTDPLGAADWRQAVTVELARRVRADLAIGGEA